MARIKQSRSEGDIGLTQPGAATVDNINRNRAGVMAGLIEAWSTSPVEEQINRLKLLKTTMYGRPNYELLRCRFLVAK